MARNLATAALAATGLTLLGIALIDWAAYTSFTISLIWNERLGDILSPLTGIAPHSFLILGAGCASVVLAVLALPRLRRAQGLTLPAAFAPAAGGLLIAAALGVLLIQGARTKMLGAFLHPSAADTLAVDLASVLSIQTNGLAVTLIALVWGLRSLALCLVIAALTSKQDPKLRILGAVAAAGLLAPLEMACRGVLQYVLTVIHNLATLAGVDRSLKTAMCAKGLEDAYAALARSRQGALALGGVGGALLLAAAGVAARRTLVVSRGATVAAALTLCVGATAFALTRGYAHDGAHPLEVLPGLVLAPDQLAHVPRLPVGERCPEAAAPLVRILEGEVSLDGRKLHAPTDLIDQLTTLTNNYRLLHPNEKLPIPQALMVVDAALPMARVTPWTDGLKRGSFTEVALIVASPHSSETRTLGRLDRPLGCAFPLKLDAAPDPLAGHATWGAFSAAVIAAYRPAK